jgi:hypothetical protein
VCSTTFVFKELRTSSQNFGDIRVQTKAHRHVVGSERRRAVTSRAPARRARALAASASAPAHRPSCVPSPRARAPRLLEVFPGHASPSSAPYPVGCAPRTAGPSAVPHRTRAGRGRPYHGRIFTVMPSSSPVEPPYLRPRSPLARTAISIAAAIAAS